MTPFEFGTFDNMMNNMTNDIWVRIRDLQWEGNNSFTCLFDSIDWGQIRVWWTKPQIIMVPSRIILAAPNVSANVL